MFSQVTQIDMDLKTDFYLHPMHIRDIMMWSKIRFSWQGVMRDAKKKKNTVTTTNLKKT